MALATFYRSIVSQMTVPVSDVRFPAATARERKATVWTQRSWQRSLAVAARFIFMHFPAS
jgi:hypothetical protein